MSRKFTDNVDLADNPTTRTPVVLCIDTSGSMNEYIAELESTLADEMVRGVNIFYEAIKSDIVARASCEIAIVSFNYEVNVLEDFETVDFKKPFRKPEIAGYTYMNAGVTKALDLLEDRKEDYKNNGVDYHQPWLILFTDGEPSDDVAQAQRRTIQLENEKRLTVFTFALSKDVNMNTLQGFSKRKPLSIKEDKIKEFFTWLGKSVSALSNSNPGEGIKLDVSDLDEWASI